MPIAVKLSRKFYDALGDEVVNELVEVLNQVDFAYRGTLKELNEANMARIDERFSRVDERFALFDEKLARLGSELRAEMQAGFARADARLEQEITGLRGEMQAGFAKVDTKFAELRGEMQAGFAKAEAKVEQRITEVHAEIAKLSREIVSSRGELVKWMFLFWAGTALTVIGLLKF